MPLSSLVIWGSATPPGVLDAPAGGTCAGRSYAQNGIEGNLGIGWLLLFWKRTRSGKGTRPGRHNLDLALPLFILRSVVTP